MSRHVHHRPTLMLIAAAACWGVGTVISKYALATVEPFFLLSIQLLTSTVFLATVIWMRRVRITWTLELRRLGALGVVNPGLAYALGLLGLSSINASTSVLIWAVVSGLPYYGVAFWLYLTGLAQVTASFAGSFLPLVPVFGVAAAATLGNSYPIASGSARSSS
ncbi:MAG: DMT family transporter [Microbacteriaceae bacterium]